MFHISTKYLRKLIIKDYCSYLSPKPNGLELFDWKYKMRSHWITIKDIIKMKKGEKIKVLLLDRNIRDNVGNFNKPNKSYTPK